MKPFASLGISLAILLFVVYACMAIDVPSANGATDHAYNGDADSCHNIAVEVPSETAACSSGISSAGTTSYGNTITITVHKDITTSLSLYWDSFWCPDGRNYCTQNKHETPFSYPHGLKAGTYSFSVNRTTDNGLACGSVQTDFWFTYNNGKCGSYYNGGFGYGAWGYCRLWNGQMVSEDKAIACSSQPKPTPTPQISIVIKPFTAPAATPTPTKVVSTGCNNVQNGNGGSANNNCNINTNTQTQTQTQNNSQTITVAAAIQPTPQVMAATTTTTQLPSTGIPFDQLSLLLGAFPLGVVCRKRAKSILL